jgi:hypothetical protein
MPYFDPETETPEPEEGQGFDPLPEGWYHAVIISSEDAEGKKPDAGTMLTLRVELDPNKHPQHGKRQFFARLCIHHKNKTPRNIARRHLSAICAAVGLQPMNSPEELLGARIMIRLKFKPAEVREGRSYDAGNEIADYAAIDAEKTNEAPKSDSAPVEAAQEERKPAAKPGGWKR